MMLKDCDQSGIVIKVGSTIGIQRNSSAKEHPAWYTTRSLQTTVQDYFCRIVETSFRIGYFQILFAPLHVPNTVLTLPTPMRTFSPYDLSRRHVRGYPTHIKCAVLQHGIPR